MDALFQPRHRISFRDSDLNKTRHRREVSRTHDRIKDYGKRRQHSGVGTTGVA